MSETSTYHDAADTRTCFFDGLPPKIQIAAQVRSERPYQSAQESDVPPLDPVSFQYLRPKTQVPFPQLTPEKAANLELLLVKVLANKELIARGGYLTATWRTYRGKRLGPYYQVEFWDSGVRRKIYLGRNPELLERAKLVLETLKAPIRENRFLRRTRAAAWAALRQSLLDIDKELASTDFYRRGTRFCKRRKTLK